VEDDKIKFLNSSPPLFTKGCAFLETGYKVGDCMTLHPIMVSCDMSISACAKLMKEKHVGSLLVENEKKLVGLLTEQDLVRNGLAEGKNPETTKADEVMIKIEELVTISPEQDLFQALKVMRDYNIRHLPVMDGELLVGFLTSKDILKIQPQLFELLAEKIVLREENRKPLLSADDKELCSDCREYSDDLEEVDGRYLCPNCRNSTEHVDFSEEEEEL
jgi:CBS domain-containing protein